jgi:hypothetical protein
VGDRELFSYFAISDEWNILKISIFGESIRISLVVKEIMGRTWMGYREALWFQPYAMTLSKSTVPN